MRRPAARAVVLAAALAACGDDAPEYLDRAAMLDPDSCMDCHPKHVEEWRSSMHAYAADDPVFLAMNARGQRETGGALGDFCVKCHAPMAVRDGLTTDGLNLAELPQAYKGVTCFFCHTAEAVEGEHNNPIRLANDLVMRGGFGDAVENGVHATGYSPLLDRRRPESSAMCGSCHDIVTPAGVHLERTFLEYRESIFPRLPGFPLSCGNCHTPGREDVVADFDGVPLRLRHEHTFPGFDTAITDWPGKALQREHIERDFAALLSRKVCHNPAGNKIEVRLTNIGAGHMFPSGAAQDRRAWVELRAYAGDELILSSGVVPEGGSVTELDDPNLWQLRDFGLDAEGKEAHMFWDVASYTSSLLPPAKMVGEDHSVLREYLLGAAPAPDRIELRVHLQAIGRDVLDDLIASGDLAAEFRDAMPTFTIATLDWTAAAAGLDRCVALPPE
jgi:hypothetical protein